VRTEQPQAPTAVAPPDGAVGAAAPTFDALIPPAMAAKAADVGESKAGMAVVPMFVLAVLAGAFIALGAMFSTVVTAGSADVPFGLARLVGGVAFSLGLILVVVAGAELFTGNNLIVMAWAERRIPVVWVLRNWAIVYAGNLVGAVATAGLVFFSKQYAFGDGKVGAQALTIAETKGGLGFGQALLLGVLCNVLVCLAVWLCYSARTVTDKILAIVFPITAFVAAGFEHSIANMYFLPIAVFIRDGADDSFWSNAGVSPGDFPHVGWGDAVSNIVPVTLGNVFGGAVMVGLVYWLIYRRRVAS
jgi:formate transporter